MQQIKLIMAAFCCLIKISILLSFCGLWSYFRMLAVKFVLRFSPTAFSPKMFDSCQKTFPQPALLFLVFSSLPSIAHFEIFPPKQTDQNMKYSHPNRQTKIWNIPTQTDRPKYEIFPPKQTDQNMKYSHPNRQTKIWNIPTQTDQNIKRLHITVS